MNNGAIFAAIPNTLELGNTRQPVSEASRRCPESEQIWSEARREAN